MERTTALKKLKKLLGNKVGYRINTAALSPEEREVLKAQLPQAIKERDELKEKREARLKVILADPEYQSLKAAASEASERVNKLSHRTHLRKIEVGVSNDMFFLHKANGDSWEEVINKLSVNP
jgi:hypothetical protein